MDEVVVIGVGNPDRGDDAAGPAVAAALEGLLPPGVRLTTTVGSDPATLWEKWEGARHAVLADAMVSGAPPGTVRRFDVSRDRLPAAVRLVSTHALGAPLAIEMARALGRLPGSISVYGIEGRAFDGGSAMSPDVAMAVPVVAARILGEVAGVAGGATTCAGPGPGGGGGATEVG